mmetsp:Transcript_6730/g.12457  ORF Transcript_6730/g.12457 Transcript_6730/m.12457 type:complete len:565 (+) Transcript_6730:51-1745(+)
MSKRKYGVDEPLSREKPSEDDLRCTRVLVDVMKGLDLYESDERGIKRQEVLAELNEIIQEWAYEVAIECGFAEELAREQGARIYAFGSYRLGVHGPTSDIDTLCVVPKHVTIEHFFQNLVPKLKALDVVKELSAVEDAYVPVAKFCYDTVDIDLIFSRLSLSVIPDEWDPHDNKNLKNLDPKSQKSLNGCRDTDAILKLVPSVDEFRTTLRFIKRWAKKRAVYSNKFGFLGGISWAILTAKICQLFPNQTASRILVWFFMFFDRWKWPSPIKLTDIVQLPNLNLEVWDPQTAHKQLAPIITPAYPAMNSTYNINKSTLKVLKSEFKRGRDLTEKLLNPKNTDEEIAKIWHKLMEPSDFFLQCKHYLQVIITAPDEDSLQGWLGTVESKMRFLVMRLQPPFTHHVTVYPYPYHKKHPKADFKESFFLGLEFEEGKKDIYLADAVEFFQSKLSRHPTRTKEMGLDIKHIRAKMLPEFVFHDERRPPKWKSAADRKKKKRKKRGRDDTTANGVAKMEEPKGTNGEAKKEGENPDAKKEGEKKRKVEMTTEESPLKKQRLETKEDEKK